MKFRVVFAALALLMATLIFAPAPAPAQDIDGNWCGTPYPGWWKRKFGPRTFQIGDLRVERIGPSTIKGYDVYSLTMQVKNVGTQDYKSGLSYGLSSGSYYPNPDDDDDWGPWGPVVHIDRIANGLLLPAVQAGGSIVIRTRMNVPNTGRFIKGVTMEIR